MASFKISILGAISLIGGALSQRSYNSCEATTIISKTETQTTTYTLTSTISTTSTLYETLSVPSSSYPTSIGPYYHQTIGVPVSSLVQTRAPQPDQYITVTIVQAPPSSVQITHTYTFTSTLTNTVTETVTKHNPSYGVPNTSPTAVSPANVTTVHQTTTIYQTIITALPGDLPTSYGPQAYGSPISQTLDHKPSPSYYPRPVANPGYGGPPYQPSTTRPRTWRPYRPLHHTHTATANHYSLIYSGVPVNTPSSIPPPGSSVIPVAPPAYPATPSAYSPPSNGVVSYHGKTESKTKTGGSHHAAHNSGSKSDHLTRLEGESRHNSHDKPTFSYSPPVVDTPSNMQPVLTPTAYGPTTVYSPLGYPTSAPSTTSPSSVASTINVSLSNTVLTLPHPTISSPASERVPSYNGQQIHSHRTRTTLEASISYSPGSQTSNHTNIPLTYGTFSSVPSYGVNSPSEQVPSAHQASSTLHVMPPNHHTHASYLPLTSSTYPHETATTSCEPDDGLQATGYRPPPYGGPPFVSTRLSSVGGTDVPAYEAPPVQAYNKSNNKLKGRGTLRKSVDRSYALQKPAVCGMLGNFTMNWDDEPVFASPILANQDFSPASNPYHHMFFSNGYTYAPQAIDQIRPISLPYVAMFKKDAAGALGAGPRTSMRAFWFNAFNTYLGCDNKGLDHCDVLIKGYSYDRETKTEVQVAEQGVLLPPCNHYRNCQLTKIEFNSAFEGLSAITIAAAVNGVSRAVYVDDLVLEWSDGSCEAGLERSRAYK